MSRVRPGVLDTRASCFWLASAFSSEDFPTLLRPTKATSAWQTPSFFASAAEVTNLASVRGWAMGIQSSVFSLQSAARQTVTRLVGAG